MLRLSTFGGLSLGDGEASEVAIPRRCLAILALLACAGDRGLTRDKLIAYLWPESSSDDARHSLEQLLYSIRRQAGATVFAGTDPLRLNASVVSTDIATFEQALERHADDAAVAAYTGPFLDGFYVKNAGEFERWVEEERARLSAAYGSALERVADSATKREDWPAAIAAWRSVSALDRLSARAVLGLVRTLAAAGDRPEALRAAAAYESLVAEELDMPIEPRLAAFVQSLRAANTEVPRAVQPQLLIVSDQIEHERIARGEPAADGGSDVGIAKPSTTHTRHSRFRRAAWLLAASLVLIGAWRVVRGPVVAPETKPGQQRVAVMVFENRTGDSTLDIVGIMAADYTRAALDRTGLLFVVAPAFDLWQRENARPARAVSMDTLVRITGATIIVSGAYYREGDSLLFMGQGIDTKSRRIIFSFDSVRSGLSQHAEAIEQVRQHVMSAIATRVDPSLSAWAGNAGAPPVKFAAYQEFAEGMTSFVSGIAEQQGAFRGLPRFASAREHLERAFRLDSTYNVAALWLFWARYNVGDRIGADSVLRRLERRRALMSPYERVLYDYNVALMRGTAEQRFQLDKQLVSFAPASEFLFCLARDALESGHPDDALDVLNRVDDSYSWVRLMRFPRGLRVRGLLEQGNHERAIQTAQRLYKEAPGDLTPAYPEIDALAALGRLDDIEHVAEQASHSLIRNGDVGNLMLYAGLRLESAGRNEHAQRFFARALQLYGPNEVENASQDVQRGRARSLYYLQRWDDARKAFEQLANAPSNTSTTDWRSLLFLGSLATRRGDTAEVSRIRSHLHASSMNPAISQYFEARVAAVGGQRDRALELLATAISLGVLAEEFIMNGDAAPSMDPDFSALRAAPAFRSAVGSW